MLKLSEILFIPIILYVISGVNGSLFKSGKEYTYTYNATSNSGVFLPSIASSSWGFHGELAIQANENSIIMQLQSLKMNIWNGRIEDGSKNIDINMDELMKPFEITYNMGLLQNLSVQAEPLWSINIKRSIAGIFQLNLSNLEKQVLAFHSMETNHYGNCDVEYVVNYGNDKEMLVRKTFDPRTCVNHPHQTWSNTLPLQCSQDRTPIIKSSERQYRVKSNENIQEIVSVNASGGIYIQPLQSYGEAQFQFSRQELQLISVKDITHRMSLIDSHHVRLEHELLDIDLTQGRGTFDKDIIFKHIGNLLDRLSQRLENPGMDTEVNNLHNTTISVLFYYLGMLDRVDLQIAYNKISGTSYKEETIRNMFLEVLPQIGTKEAALFITDLIQSKKVSDIIAIQLLAQFPFHLRKPDVELLKNLELLLNLPDQIASEVQNTAVLTFGTLIYKTCSVYCSPELLDDYVRLYLDKFIEATQYAEKMVWLEGLANIQLGRVVKFLEPIALGNNDESRHFRVLAAWASLPTAYSQPEVIYPVYWPVLVNRTEHLEMRIVALTLLIVSNPTTSRLISLYWYLQSEPSQHLYNYFYTTLKSLERTTHPCYAHLSEIAAQFVRIVHKPVPNRPIVTGSYLFDYQDTYRKFGAMLQSVVIANPLTNIPEVLYLTLNNYAGGININHVSLYIKAEGLLHSLSNYLDNPTQVKDILKNYKIDQKQSTPIHLEVIVRIQQKTVLCLHLNETSISKAFKYMSALPNNMYHAFQNVELHVNQQRINVPLIIESIQATELGTNVRLSGSGISLFSMRGNFTHVLNARNNHVILRTSIHGTETIESYNPLIDLWYGAERAQSIHGYLPINITIGLEERPFISYNTPNEPLKMGITAHVRTVTSIKGSRAAAKLKDACPKCPMLYTVSRSPDPDLKTLNIHEVAFPELGGHFYFKVFNCESSISQDKIISDVLAAHRANYRIWPVTQFALIGVHFIDYLSYVPPKGSCGLAAYIETDHIKQSQIRLEYIKSGKYHMLSLTRTASESQQILYQWNLAALYEATSWISDAIKIKATKVTIGEPVLKFCIEVERETPWEWDFLSTKPSNPARIKVNTVWGLSDSAKGKCSGSSIQLDLLGEITSSQIEESRKSKWPYDTCREESKGKSFVPYTVACHEASKELSTLRKYQVICQYENLPDILSKLAWRIRGFYDLIGGNSTVLTQSGQFSVTAVFPKDSSTGELRVNRDKISIEYDPHFIDYFLTRTRIHKYTEISLLRTFFKMCVVSQNSIRSAHDILVSFKKKSDVLILGQCYDENPKYIITAENLETGVAIYLSDESNTLTIKPEGNGGAVYNSTMYLPIERNYVFQSLGSTRIRLDDKSVDLFFPNIYMFIHWTQEQILFFFPSYILEFSCGICTSLNIDDKDLYRRLGKS